MSVAPHRAEIRAIYDDLDAEIARRSPACAISGRCCRFEAYGHTLFLSAPEAAILVEDAPPPARPLDRGATCPWQDGRGRCTAREARPLGCRVYFCDPTFQDELPEISERYISRLKDVADRFGLPWSYAPLHRHLEAAASDGRIAFPMSPDDPTTPH